MKNLLFTFCVLIIAHIGWAQNSDCTPKIPYKINTASGMKMRSGPGTNFGVVVTVPSATQVLVCKETDKAATFENKPGHWRKVQYKTHVGYMFDGFLTPVETGNITINEGEFSIEQLQQINLYLAVHPEKTDSVLTFLNDIMTDEEYENFIQSLTEKKENAEEEKVAEKKPEPKEELKPQLDFKFITESYNYCGDIADLDPGKVWYGVYKQGPGFVRKRVDLLILRSKYSLGSGLEFDIKTDNDESALFLFSVGKKLHDTAWFVAQRPDFFVDNPKKLFPGQQVELYGKQEVAAMQNVTLFATGIVSDVGKCPELSNYKIKVTGEMHDDLKVQDLTPFFADMGECGMPEIYWFGDLNDDSYPEIIFFSASENGYIFTLIVSDLHNKKVLYKKGYEWLNLNCE